MGRQLLHDKGKMKKTMMLEYPTGLAAEELKI